MTLVPEFELASRRLAKFIDNPDVPEVARYLTTVTDPKVRSFIARSLRAQATNEVFDVVSEPNAGLSAAQMMDLRRRVFAGCRRQLSGVFPDDIVDEAFGPIGGAS